MNHLWLAHLRDACCRQARTENREGNTICYKRRELSPPRHIRRDCEGLVILRRPKAWSLNRSGKSSNSLLYLNDAPSSMNKTNVPSKMDIMKKRVMKRRVIPQALWTLPFASCAQEANNLDVIPWTGPMGPVHLPSPSEVPS